MAVEDLCYDANYINYESDFNTILDGINKYKKEIYVLDSANQPRNVIVEYFKNVSVDKKGVYSSVNKSNVEPFAGYEDYYTRLLDSMNRLAENAKDSARHSRYGMVTTISRGYDAPCCAAMAKKVGCNTAITFKAEGKYKDDCGTEVAKTLGYQNIVEVDANEYLTRTDFVEAEYICSGELGAQISFSSFDKYIKGNICFTGERGDSIWNKDALNRNNAFIFEDMLSHLGSCERRLWINYISVPMSLFGASSWTSIFEISNSEEMKPWRMNNNYDRPIPRRIIEDSGVQRNQFGITKHGAGFIYKFDWLKRVLSKMLPTTAADFLQYVKNHKRLRIVPLIHFLWKIRGLYLSRLRIKAKTLTVKDYSTIANPMAVSLLIPWSGEMMIKRYKKVFERD